MTCSTSPVSREIVGWPVANASASSLTMRLASGLRTARTSAPCRISSRTIRGVSIAAIEPVTPSTILRPARSIERRPWITRLGCMASEPGRPTEGKSRPSAAPGRLIPRTGSPGPMARRTPADDEPRDAPPAGGTPLPMVGPATSQFAEISRAVIREEPTVEPRRLERGAVIFDVDGTLLDDMGPISELAGKLLFETFGTPELEGRLHYLATTGMPFEAQLSQLLPERLRGRPALGRPDVPHAEGPGGVRHREAVPGDAEDC